MNTTITEIAARGGEARAALARRPQETPPFLRRPLRAARVTTSAWLKTMPAVFLPVATLRENHKRTRVRRDSDLVIEGYWRCGNHFATYAFMQSQTRPVHVAHHFHAPAQLMLAVRWQIPAVLLVREPLSAVASATVFLGREDPAPLLHFYNIFHRTLLPYRDRIVVSDFSRTINDFGSVGAEVNRRFGRNFEIFCGGGPERRRVEEAIRREHRENMDANPATLPMPSAEKERRKQVVIERLEARETASQLAEAQRLYESLIASAVSGRGT